MQTGQREITAATLIQAFTAQVDAMLASDEPVGTIVLPFLWQHQQQSIVTLLGGNLSPHGGYMHRRSVQALLTDDGLPAIFDKEGHDVHALTQAALLELDCSPSTKMTLQPARLPPGLRAKPEPLVDQALSLPMYRSRSVIRPKGFTFSHSR
jgi:hypothetical protein